MDVPADERAARCRRLIRNLDEVAPAHRQRELRVDPRCRPLPDGTAAAQLGSGIDVPAPGKRGGPYHDHLVQEELFVLLDGEGTLRVAGRMLDDWDGQR